MLSTATVAQEMDGISTSGCSRTVIWRIVDSKGGNLTRIGVGAVVRWGA